MSNEIYHRSNWGNPKPEGWGDIYFDPSATNKLYNHSDYYENSDGTDKILRDIPNKASIVLTPTAYSDGSINTVIPPYGLGVELVTNGTFDTDSDWIKETGWSIGENGASHNGVAGAIYQTNSSIINGRTYKISLTVLNVTSGTLTPFIAGTNSNLSINQDGSYSAIVVAGSGTRSIDLFSNASFVGTVSNVSVKEVQEADFDFSRGSSATRVNEKGLIEEVASGIPRIDYTDGTGSWLLEPQSTNLLPYSEDFTQWILGTNSTLTFESNVIAPDGSLGVYRLQHPQTSSTFLAGGFANCRNFSLFVKAVTEGVNNQFNLDATGQPTDTKTATTKWQRFDRDFGTQANYSLSINNGIDNYASDIYIWGAQAEVISYATSYIPTNGSTVTRSADVANNSGNADLFNDSEGVLYAEIAALADDATSRRISLSNGFNRNKVEILFQNSGTVSSRVRSGNSFQGSGTFNLTQTEYNKIAVKYKSNDLALWVNGLERSTDNSANTPIGLSELAFDNGVGGSDFYGKVKCVAVFKEALTDAELESLTS